MLAKSSDQASMATEPEDKWITGTRLKNEIE